MIHRSITVIRDSLIISLAARGELVEPRRSRFDKLSVSGLLNTLVFIGAMFLALSACAPAAGQPPAASSQAPGQAVGPADATIAQSGSGAAPSGGVRYTIASGQSEARYRIREQLVELSLPSDAVGSTKALSGSLTFAADGSIVKDLSKFELDASTFKSDKDLRDNFLRRSVLQTGQFPKISFVPTEVKGLPSPLPTTGEHAFQITGDLTVRSATTPVTWQATASFSGQDVMVKASTSLTFADIKLQKPSVPVLLSVQDIIKLELEATLTRAV